MFNIFSFFRKGNGSGSGGGECKKERKPAVANLVIQVITPVDKDSCGYFGESKVSGMSGLPYIYALNSETSLSYYFPVNRRNSVVQPKVSSTPDAAQLFVIDFANEQGITSQVKLLEQLLLHDNKTPITVVGLNYNEKKHAESLTVLSSIDQWSQLSPCIISEKECKKTAQSIIALTVHKSIAAAKEAKEAKSSSFRC
jgi:hypothetical protein